MYKGSLPADRFSLQNAILLPCACALLTTKIDSAADDDAMMSMMIQ